MSTITIGVASVADTQRRASAAFRGKKQGARISFASEDLLWKTLTPKRWGLLRVGVLEKAAEGGVVFPYDAIPRGFSAKSSVTAWPRHRGARQCDDLLARNGRKAFQTVVDGTAAAYVIRKRLNGNAPAGER